MYEGHTDKAKGDRFQGGRQGWVGRVGGCGGVKMEKTILEQQFKKYKKKRERSPNSYVGEFYKLCVLALMIIKHLGSFLELIK